MKPRTSSDTNFLGEEGVTGYVCSATASGTQRKPQVAGLAEDAAKREREPWLSAAAEVGDLLS